ncbi:MAG: phosphotransferase [Nocardioides sp.]
MTPEIEALLDQIPILADRTLVEELSGGLTNRNLRVHRPSGDVVVRLAGASGELLEIDRVAEHHDSVAAAASGAAPEVLAHHPELAAMVIDYVPGSTLSNDSFADAGVMARAAGAVRQLHAGPAFARTFSMFERRERYLATIAERGFELPPDYHRFDAHWADVRRVLEGTAAELAPCNNDLLAENYVDDGDRCWLIDYDYAANGDPAFDLGNTATECEFTPEQTEAWVEQYYGALTPARLSRVRLQALCSAYGWSLWGYIQKDASDLDFDYEGWGLHRFDKAARVFTSPHFTRLLTAVVEERTT